MGLLNYYEEGGGALTFMYNGIERIMISFA